MPLGIPPEIPPEMPPPDLGEGLPPMPPEGAVPPTSGGDAATAIDKILAGGASSGAEIVAGLEGQGFIVEGGGAPMPGEMPLPEEMPMEEPMPEEMDLLGAARAGMAEGDNLKEQRRAEAGY